MSFAFVGRHHERVGQRVVRERADERSAPPSSSGRAPAAFGRTEDDLADERVGRELAGDRVLLRPSSPPTLVRARLHVDLDHELALDVVRPGDASRCRARSGDRAGTSRSSTVIIAAKVVERFAPRLLHASETSSRNFIRRCSRRAARRGRAGRSSSWITRLRILSTISRSWVTIRTVVPDWLIR